MTTPVQSPASVHLRGVVCAHVAQERLYQEKQRLSSSCLCRYIPPEVFVLLAAVDTVHQEASGARSHPAALPAQVQRPSPSLRMIRQLHAAVEVHAPVLASCTAPAPGHDHCQVDIPARIL